MMFDKLLAASAVWNEGRNQQNLEIKRRAVRQAVAWHRARKSKYTRPLERDQDLGAIKKAWNDYRLAPRNAAA